MTRPIYLVLLSDHVGGAEIRFFRIFKQLIKNSSSINLILCKGFLKKVISFDEFKDFSSYSNNIKDIKTFSYYQKKSFNTIYTDVCSIVETNSILHFNQNFPATYPKKITHKTIYTFNENSLTRFSLKDHLFFVLILLRANITDILDPIIQLKYKRLLFFKKEINRTQAGSVNPFDYKFHFQQKRNSIVFSGRFTNQKQVLLYANSIDQIYKDLTLQNISIEFYIIGNGPLTTIVNKKVSSLRKKGVIIHTGFMKDYKQIIENSKLFLSIQKYNNYPSNSLMEAMACGNIPITIDNGSTKLLAKEDYSYYLPENFSPKQLSECISGIFQLSKQDFEKRATLARETIKTEYNVNLAAKYYSNLYNSL